MHYPRSHPRKLGGFTLIELLLVIAIIAILAAIVIIAINPTRQLGQANDTRRRSNVREILNAVSQYMVDNRGQIPGSITSTSTPVCVTGFTSSTCIDLSAVTNNQLYLVSIPTDPLSPGTTSTWYNISKSTSTNPRITVTAPNAEQTSSISVTR